jgi:hypothetical protein
MKLKNLTTTIALLLFITITLGSASASSKRKGELHLTKNCSTYTGAAGSFCVITSSDFPEIIANATKFFYDQPVGIPAGMLDSNVILDAGDGNRATGRCTLDLVALRGLCTFSDGTGRFTGFKARIDVVKIPDGTRDWSLEGTYSFDPETDGDDDRK